MGKTRDLGIGLLGLCEQVINDRAPNGMQVRLWVSHNRLPLWNLVGDGWTLNNNFHCGFHRGFHSGFYRVTSISTELSTGVDERVIHSLVHGCG